MPQNDKELTAAYFRQGSAALATLPAGGDWDTDGAVVEFLPLEVTTDGIGEAAVENAAIQRRAQGFHTHLPGLRSGSGLAFKMHLSGSAVTTAADAAAATFALAEMLENAWAGLHLGYSSLVVTPSTTAPDITVGQGTNHPAGGFIFGVDSAGAGEFLCVDSVSTDVLTLRTTATNAVATVGSAIACFPDTRALPDSDDSSNITHAFYLRGEHTEANLEVLGVALSVTGIESNGPGEDAKLVFTGMHSNFVSHAVTRRALTGTPQGPAGPVVGRSGTAIRMADLGTPGMTTLNAHSFTFTPGIARTPVPGVGGQQGVMRYAYTPGPTVLEIVVDFDEQHGIDFEAQTYKHVMIQVGDARGDAWGIYMPRALIKLDPGWQGASEQITMTLQLHAHEFVGTTHTEGTDNYELERAGWAVLLCA